MTEDLNGAPLSQGFLREGLTAGWLEGRSVRLRAVEPSDAEYMYRVENDTESWRCSDLRAPMSLHMIREYAEGYDADPFRAGQLRFIVLDKSTGRRVGIADLYRVNLTDRSAMAAVYVNPSERGRGLGSDMASVLTRYAVRLLCLHQVAALVECGHDASERLFGRCGYVKTAVLKDWKHIPGTGYRDVAVYQFIDNVLL